MLKSSFAATWIKLSMVNKSFRAMLASDTPLWRSMFFDSVMRWQSFHWTMNYSNTASLPCSEYKRRFQLEDRSPQRLNSLTDVAPSSFYKKAVQVWHIRTCGLCGTKKNHVTPTWVLGMQLCMPCAQANLASHEVLWQDYGLFMYEPAPTFAKTQRLLAVESEVHTAPVVTWLPMRVWFFKSSTTKTVRRLFTTDPRDFTQKILETPFFWKPHLARYLDMPALQEWAQEKKAAAKRLTAVLKRNFAVALRNKKTHKNNKVQAISLLKHAEILRRDPATQAYSTRLYTKIYHTVHGRILNNNQDSMPDPWLPLATA
jgi:hypothetical protein